MIKNYRKRINAMKMTVIGVFICIICLLLCTTERSIAASAKDIRKQTVVPGTTQTPSKTAPSPTASPPSNIQMKEVLPEIRRDLAVQDLVVTPNEFSLGDRINVVFDIHNLGQTHISQVSYEVRIGFFQILFSDNINNLAPNSVTGIKREVTIPQNLNTGRSIIKAAILLDDDNRENNYSAQSVTIQQETPNLRPENYQVLRTQPEPLQAGSLFKVKFRIRNSGELESIPCKYKVTTERPFLFGWRVIDERSYDIPPLRRFEFTEVSPTFQIPEDFPAGADLRITIYVDSMNQIRESSEEDNKRVITVHY